MKTALPPNAVAVVVVVVDGLDKNSGVSDCPSFSTFFSFSRSGIRSYAEICAKEGKKGAACVEAYVDGAFNFCAQWLHAAECYV